MPKRSEGFPYRSSESEQRMNSNRTYDRIIRENEKQPFRINPVFKEDYYEVKKGVANDRSN